MNINDFLKQKEDGTYEIDQAGFNAELDRERNKASETAKANAEKKLRAELEKDIRAKLEEDAKLSAEQKLQKQLEEFAEQKRAFDRDRVKTIYKDAGISDSEIELMLALIGDDSEKNLDNAKRFAEARKAADEAIKARIQEELAQNSQRANGGSDGGKTETEAEKYAKEFSAAKAVPDVVELKKR